MPCEPINLSVNPLLGNWIMGLLDQFAIACTGKWRDLRCGTGSGSDLAPQGAATTEAPGRYRSLYRTAAVPYTHLQTAIRVALSIALLTASGAAKGPRLEFRNFSSKGPEYKALENLRLAAPDIKYAGIEEADVFGKLYRASKYSLVPLVEVQTLCAIGAVNTEVYERVAANFEMHIVEDEDRSIHNEMARKMYDIWNRKEIYLGEYYYWFNAKDGAYTLTAFPDSVNVKGLYSSFEAGVRSQSFDQSRQ